MTLTVKRSHLLIMAAFALAFPVCAGADEVALYDNTSRAALFPIRLDPGDDNWAQPFFTGDSDNVSSVSISLKRTGLPGGELIFEIWDADENDRPGTKVGTLGRVDANSLPVIAGQPLVTVNGLVTDLESMTRYFLVVRKSTPIADISNTYHFGPQLSDDGTRWPVQSRVNELLIQYDDGWHNLADLLGAPAFYLHASIRAFEVIEPPTVDWESIIVPTDFGSVTKDPDNEHFPIGSEISVTADPIEGYQFVKWLYGEEQFTGNPTTITVEEGVTLTPVFVKIEEFDPLNIAIAPAVVVSWDSKSNLSYQIYASSDMENWVIVVEDIQGTGERLTHCFTREETEMFYRVESP